MAEVVAFFIGMAGWFLGYAVYLRLRARLEARRRVEVFDAHVRSLQLQAKLWDAVAQERRRG